MVQMLRLIERSVLVNPSKGKSMKYNSIQAAAVIAVLLAVTGCYSPKNVGGVKTLGVVQTTPVESDKGYVEFISVNKDTSIPIYQVDKQGNQYLLANMGLRAGDAYWQDRYGTIVQNLRVSEPAGDQKFMIDRNGERITVPVKEGKITPVEINYVTLDNGDIVRTYRMNYRIFEPVPYQDQELRSEVADNSAKDQKKPD